MRAHSSGRVTSFVTMRVRWRKIWCVRSYSEYPPAVRHIHVNTHKRSESIKNTRNVNHVADIEMVIWTSLASKNLTNLQKPITLVKRILYTSEDMMHTTTTYHNLIHWIWQPAAYWHSISVHKPMFRLSRRKKYHTETSVAHVTMHVCFFFFFFF
jgi:hypothetical protein